MVRKGISDNYLSRDLKQESSSMGKSISGKETAHPKALRQEDIHTQRTVKVPV